MNPRARFSILYYLWVLLLIFSIDSLFFSGPNVKDIPYSEFLARVSKDQVQAVVLTPSEIYGEMKGPPGEESKDGTDAIEAPDTHTPWRFSWSAIQAWFAARKEQVQQARKESQEELARQFTVTPVADPTLVDTLQKHGVEFRARIETHFFRNLFFDWIIPFGILFLLWGFIMRRMGQGPSVLNIGKSKAKLYELDPNNSIRFGDVAGIDEAIEETREVVSFLKEPERFQKLGAKLPTGVLLVGPPGTGKTLLARAVAGEAGVPFFNLSGSDFVEMFVGVGAARVRDLFAEARKKAPCIVFIDELDAIGRARSGNASFAGGGYDERENTLNQLLVELDGFDGRASVVIMAATNRPEVLDKALLRPGRFDRQILVDRPDREGRFAIFKLHAAKLPLDPDVDLARIAAQTPGFVGADIANICNEAALLAARRSHPTVKMIDFQDAFERVVAGLERKGRVLNPAEKRIVAYHESGHALVGYFTAGADPVERISIVPRGKGALGYTLQAPTEDRYLMSRAELLGRIRTLLGGRASEEVVFGQVSTGASDDLEKAGKIARSMLTVYGMSERLPNLSLVEQNEGFLGHGPTAGSRSPEIERIVGEEQLEILRSCYEEAKRMLTERRTQLEALATRLLDREKLDAKDLAEILGPRPDQPTAAA
ncbi:MAG: ATP-dependent zinc metalloprotease FtsH [Deltaproteobacteria bacterium]|nr:ATP-dependent zinc metalloprotease FtsH [Deltaproteobacteria bacterium]